MALQTHLSRYLFSYLVSIFFYFVDFNWILSVQKSEISNNEQQSMNQHWHTEPQEVKTELTDQKEPTKLIILCVSNVNVE